MTIEVRQLLVRALVDPDEPASASSSEDGGGSNGVAPESLEQLREELLAECKAWLGEQLRQARER